MRSDWTHLISSLKDRGIQSEHIERLRAHLNTEEQQLHLEQELKSEIARALGRAERNARRLEAIEARQDYKIHREAIGLRRNKYIDALFPIPPPRTE